MSLLFHGADYSVEKIECDGIKLTYRAFEHIPYCEKPSDGKMQCLSIFVPEAFYLGQSINGYSLLTAPIFFPNTVGGYMPGPEERPGPDFMGQTNASFHALIHGYVVVSAGVRGRGLKDGRGKNIGIAPAHIVDLKAAVRYLKANEGSIPGNVRRIISNGTSAGGALSSLLGASGNHPDYQTYLDEIGAADTDDSVFAASCYCPITNLDHADLAYEWEFNGINDCHRVRFDSPSPGEKKPKMTLVDESMTDFQKRLSDKMKPMFSAYLNSLSLKDKNGKALTIDQDGSGSFRDYLSGKIKDSAQTELNRMKKGFPTDPITGTKYEELRHSAPNTSVNPSEAEGVKTEYGSVVSVDFPAFAHFRTRMKEAPAFDDIRLHTPENELFGSAEIPVRHFTEFSKEQDDASGPLAEEEQIRMMNPMDYIGDPEANCAEHFRIRHGAVDRDTSLAISEMLALKLLNNGIDVNIEHPWGIPHAGDYDLAELFRWIDELCK